MACRSFKPYLVIFSLLLQALTCVQSFHHVPSSSRSLSVKSKLQRMPNNGKTRSTLGATPSYSSIPIRGVSFRGGQTVASAVGTSIVSFLKMVVQNGIIDLTMLQKGVFVTFITTAYLLGKLPTPFAAYRDVMEIPKRCFGSTASFMVGRAVSVSDGDTIRFYHTPNPFRRNNVPAKMKKSQVALPIRVCTIDTPETSKFGKKGQPFGKEAKEALRALLENETVLVRLLQKDQYGRAVAQVAVRQRGLLGKVLRRKTFVDEYMLRQGLAEVYQGGGAVYGNQGKERYLELQSEALADKKGIWSLKNRESAADYKKRTK